MLHTMFGTVYKIINKLDSKIYIGQTTQPLNDRWAQHKCDAKLFRHDMVIHRAIRKYAIENVSIVPIVLCKSIEELNHREAYYIKLFNSIAPNGYNTDPGGGNRKMTEQTKKRLSIKATGRKCGPAWNKGIPATKETIAKLKAAQAGENNGMFGRTHREDSRKKISEKAKGRKPPPGLIENLAKINSKPVICLQTGEIFGSAVIAANKLGMGADRIGKVINGKIKSYKGLTFARYIEGNNYELVQMIQKNEKPKKESKPKKILNNEQKSERISKALKGKPKSEEHKKNLSIAKTGTKHTEQAKNKISLWLLENSPWKGKFHTAEAKEKIANKRKIPIICNETGVEYAGSTDAAKALGITKGSINNILKGKCKRTRNGCSFSYLKKS
jgi:group I intron endonuclease